MKNRSQKIVTKNASIDITIGSGARLLVYFVGMSASCRILRNQFVVVVLVIVEQESEEKQ